MNIADSVVAAILGMVLGEVAFRILRKGWHSAVLVRSKQALRIVRSNLISDHWKERALLLYAGQIALSNLKLCLGLAGCVLAILAVLLPYSLVGEGPYQFLASWVNLLVMTIASTVYILPRFRCG